MAQIIPARRTPFADQMMKEISQNTGTGLERLFNKGQTRKESHEESLAKSKFEKEKELIQLKEDAKLKTKKDIFDYQVEQLKGMKGDKSEKIDQGIENEPKERSVQDEESPYSDEEIEISNLISPAIGRDRREQVKSKDKKIAAQKKEVADSFGGENGKYITKVHDQYEDTLRKEAIFGRMEQLENSEQLSESGIINLLETIGFKPEWLKNPKNEEYNKLSLDLLGGGTLQADYGSKLFASEFAVSQQRIPSLSQTPEGRRQIRENLQTALLPAKLKQERLQYYIDKAERTGERLPYDLRGKILKDIKPELEEAYDKFKQRNGRYKVKIGTPLDEDAKEKYYYISEGNVEKARKMMLEDGYDVK
jgi:arsenate reductase-like glutaredoxin family protein